MKLRSGANSRMAVNEGPFTRRAGIRLDIRSSCNRPIGHKWDVPVRDRNHRVAKIFRCHRCTGYDLLLSAETNARVPYASRSLPGATSLQHRRVLAVLAIVPD